MSQQSTQDLEENRKEKLIEEVKLDINEYLVKKFHNYELKYPDIDISSNVIDIEEKVDANIAILMGYFDLNKKKRGPPLGLKDRYKNKKQKTITNIDDDTDFVEDVIVEKSPSIQNNEKEKEKEKDKEKEKEKEKDIYTPEGISFIRDNIVYNNQDENNNINVQYASYPSSQVFYISTHNQSDYENITPNSQLEFSKIFNEQIQKEQEPEPEPIIKKKKHGFGKTLYKTILQEEKEEEIRKVQLEKDKLSQILEKQDDSQYDSTYRSSQSSEYHSDESEEIFEEKKKSIKRKNRSSKKSKTTENAIVKRGRGRPKGSKNKNPSKRGRGRGRGKNT